MLRKRIRVAARWALPRLLALIGLALFLFLRIVDPTPVNLAREKVFDAYQRLSPRPLPAETERPVVVAAVDEESMIEYGAWPWSRTVFADLTDKLREMGAKTVVFDVMFSEPRTAAEDAELSEALRRITSAVGVGGLWRVIDGQQSGRSPFLNRVHILARGSTEAHVSKRYFPKLKTIIRNIPVIEEAVEGNGLTNIRPGRDGVIRSVQTVFWSGDRAYPSLSLEAYRLWLGSATSIVLTYSNGRIYGIGFRDQNGNSVSLKTDKFGAVRPYFTHRNQDRYISIKSILRDEIPTERVAGKIVIVGSDAIGIGDDAPSPPLFHRERCRISFASDRRNDP